MVKFYRKYINIGLFLLCTMLFILCRFYVYNNI